MSIPGSVPLRLSDPAGGALTATDEEESIQAGGAFAGAHIPPTPVAIELAPASLAADAPEPASLQPFGNTLVSQNNSSSNANQNNNAAKQATLADVDGGGAKHLPVLPVVADKSTAASIAAAMAAFNSSSSNSSHGPGDHHHKTSLRELAMHGAASSDGGSVGSGGGRKSGPGSRGSSRNPSRPPSGPGSRQTSHPPSRSLSRLPSESQMTYNMSSHPSGHSLLSALGTAHHEQQKNKRGARRASMVALSNVGGKLGGQLGEFMTKLGDGAGGSRVMPVEEEEDSDFFEEEEKSVFLNKALVTRKKRKPPPRALLGSGSADDAEKSAFTLVMMVATVFALWGTDMYEVCGPPTIVNDMALYTLVNLVFVLFVVEFLFYSLFKPGYVGSFFFYLDFLSAISLLPDALLLWNIQAFSSGGSGLAVARAGRAARAGTRAARIVRIFKLFSLIRRSRNKDKDGPKTRAQENAAAPSKVGTALSSGIIQKVIVIVAIMLVFSQLLDLISSASIFSNIQPAVGTDLESLALLWDAANGTLTVEPFYSTMVSVIAAVNGPPTAGSTCPPAALFPVLDHNTDLTGCVLRHIRIDGVDIWGTTQSYNDLRVSPQEQSINTYERSEFTISTLGDAQSAALTNVLTVLFITVLLGVSSALFQRDAQVLVIAPLELMASLVRQLAHDPLNVLSLDVDGEDKSIDGETRLVALAIIKLSQMLQVGFGEAGASIIQANMASDSDRINPVLPGRRIQGIYGFCDIRNFTDCTECLQTDVMVFVNRISDFVHRAVKENGGAPNKNIGDAFLLVWRLPEAGAQSSNSQFNNKNLTVEEQVLEKLVPKKSMADQALQSFVRIIVETAADVELLELTSRQAVQDRIPGYAVRMGFGLHVGWGIEGAIGSVMKIDATYLSPNVNMCARLEGATKTYGCVMLLTDAFYDLLSPPVQKLCRRVDRVTARGASAPFDLYTFDSVRFPDLELMRSGETFWERFPPTTSESFRATFALGVKAYIAGEWQKAATHLDECLEQVPSDGPSRFLSTLISDNRNVCPANWPGYRLNGVD